MTVTWQHLSGTFENLDKTIAYHLENDWTESIVPLFENGTDEPDYNAQFDRSGPNAILVNIIEDDYDDNTDEVNSDTVHSVLTSVAITIVAESRTARIRFENEINRILWELSPNTATRVLKSDGLNNSHLNHFIKSEVTFTQIELPNNETAYLQGSEGILLCVSYKFKS